VAILLDFQSGDAQFDRRGAQLQWASNRVRLTDGSIRPGLLLRCPSWVLSILDPQLRKHGARPIKLARSEGDPAWTNTYALTQPPSDRFRGTLELLASIQSMGRLPSNIDVSAVLDYYKIPDDELPPSLWPDTAAGRLNYRSKYCDDDRAFDELAQQLAHVVRTHPKYRVADRIASIPGRSANVRGHGERLARRVARLVDIPYLRISPTYETREQAKEGGHVLQPTDLKVGESIDDEIIVIVDDVIRSGHSMGVAASKLVAHGARKVRGLAVAKTLRN
jgi:pyrimidine operon attenuation protein/uracil phosphoribosyltransferase